MYWYLEVLKKAFDFSGRARRKEYWMFILFNSLIAIGLIFIEASLQKDGDGTFLLTTIYNLIILIPNLSVQVRRLHDTDHSGWWLLIAFVPLLGAIILFLFMIREGDLGSNRYGYNPKATKKSYAGAYGLDEF